MQISSLTAERLARLKKQIADKKAEKDELEALDEKDLWCKDLDAFEEEWDNQMRLDDEIRTNIRKMGRRVSKKIGAGKGGKRKNNDDDDFVVKAPRAKKVVTKDVKKIVPPPAKTTAQSRFASTFAQSTKPKPAGTDGADDSDEDFTASFGRGNSAKPEPVKKPTPMDLSDDDDDFAALTKPKVQAAPAKKPSPMEASDEDLDESLVAPKPKPRGRAAAKKPAPVDLSDSEEDEEDDEEDDEDDVEDDGDFAAVAEPNPKTAPAKKPSPVELSDEDEDEAFVAPKPKARARPAAKKPSPVELSDEVEEEDLAAPSQAKGKGKAAPAKKPSPAESEPEEEPEAEVTKPTNGRAKRAAAAKAKNWAFDDSDEESESDGDNMIGDVGAMVRGIGEPAAAATNGRLSLFAMSRSEHGNTAIPKLKTKQSRNFDFDSHDDTNYELLAKSSPQKPTKSSDVDELMSEDEEPVTAAKAANKAKGKAPLNVVSAGPAKKGRGRPAKAKEDPKPVKPTQLSPAARAYTAKNKASTAPVKGKKKTFDISDDEDEDGDVVMQDSPPPQPRGRPGRAAAAKKKYTMISDDEDEDGGSDVYAMNDSD